MRDLEQNEKDQAHLNEDDVIEVRKVTFFAWHSGACATHGQLQASYGVFPDMLTICLQAGEQQQ